VAGSPCGRRYDHLGAHHLLPAYTGRAEPPGSLRRRASRRGREARPIRTPYPRGRAAAGLNTSTWRSGYRCGDAGPWWSMSRRRHRDVVVSDNIQNDFTATVDGSPRLPTLITRSGGVRAGRSARSSLRAARTSVGAMVSVGSAVVLIVAAIRRMVLSARRRTVGS
jgi:hypothetical protein